MILFLQLLIHLSPQKFQVISLDVNNKHFSDLGSTPLDDRSVERSSSSSVLSRSYGMSSGSTMSLDILQLFNQDNSHHASDHNATGISPHHLGGSIQLRDDRDGHYNSDEENPRSFRESMVEYKSEENPGSFRERLSHYSSDGDSIRVIDDCKSVEKSAPYRKRSSQTRSHNSLVQLKEVLHRNMTFHITPEPATFLM